MINNSPFIDVRFLNFQKIKLKSETNFTGEKNCTCI
ncbi:unnamed protein product [Brugia timori]|uniref:Uncharacterized protein n=1 Tax=Brugia timori TaxID=42155 RepID=A0A3P7XDW3_9BILA|nr:unnamed protein product [Brugia timori]